MKKFKKIDTIKSVIHIFNEIQIILQDTLKGRDWKSFFYISRHPPEHKTQGLDQLANSSRSGAGFALTKRYNERSTLPMHIASVGEIYSIQFCNRGLLPIVIIWFYLIEHGETIYHFKANFMFFQWRNQI